MTAGTPVQITRAIIAIGQPFIGEDNGIWAPYTAAVEINNRALRGKTFSGSIPWPAGRTQAQKRNALQTILQVDGPSYFPEGSTVSGNVDLEWWGV